MDFFQMMQLHPNTPPFDLAQGSPLSLSHGERERGEGGARERSVLLKDKSVL
jgi:hypothetical protein